MAEAADAGLARSEVLLSELLEEAAAIQEALGALDAERVVTDVRRHITAYVEKVKELKAVMVQNIVDCPMPVPVSRDSLYRKHQRLRNNQEAVRALLVALGDDDEGADRNGNGMEEEDLLQ